jgi:hypothetical protein
MNKPIVIICGADRTGKTEIAKALAVRLNVPYYKAANEKANFLSEQGRFLNELRYADPARLDLLSQIGSGLIFDRGFPCERVYSWLYCRETDEMMLDRLDQRFAELGTIVIHTTRASFAGYQDEDDPKLTSDVLATISQLYEKYLASLRCRHMTLYVDDNDLCRELYDITSFISGGRNER